MKWFLRSVLFLLILVLLAGGLAGYEVHRFLSTPASGEPKDVLITIAPGATFERVARDLAEAGAITDVDRFRLLAHVRKSTNKLRAGEFEVNTGWTPEQVLHQLTNGQSKLYRLSVREGLTWWATAKAVEEQGFARYDDFKAVIHDPKFLAEHNIPFASAEGFLFPETYMLKKPRNPLDREQAWYVASTMVKAFWKQSEPLWKKLPCKPGAAENPPPPAPATASEAQTDAAALAAATDPAPSAAPAPEPVPSASATPPPAMGSATVASLPWAATAANPAYIGPQTPADIDPNALRYLIILASLVEKETAVPAERWRVAGVYANRMRLGMLLQCDPTIIYGVGEKFNGTIYRSQLNDASNLYNTYKHPGFPPGPICSSGMASLQAAFAPEQHDYLYFVATAVDGGHTFSKSVGEHNKAVQVYRARMRAGQAVRVEATKEEARAE